jgi:hypothetical protein
VLAWDGIEQLPGGQEVPQRSSMAHGFHQDGDIPPRTCAPALVRVEPDSECAHLICVAIHERLAQASDELMTSVVVPPQAVFALQSVPLWIDGARRQPE